MIAASLVAPGDAATYLMVQPLVGGWGAGHDKDGESGQFCVGNGETSNIPVELTERCYEILVERYGFHHEEGGAGHSRTGANRALQSSQSRGA